MSFLPNVVDLTCSHRRLVSTKTRIDRSTNTSLAMLQATDLGLPTTDKPRSVDGPQDGGRLGLPIHMT